MTTGGKKKYLKFPYKKYAIWERLTCLTMITNACTAVTRK